MPRPRFDAEALRLARPLAQAALYRALRAAPLAIDPLRRRNVRDALADYFGLGPAGHCFTTDPHAWASFHEPQITGGIAWFLQAGDRRTRLGRSLALMRAVGSVDLEPGAVATVEVAAESPGEGDTRMDLLVIGRTCSGIAFGGVVEAKIGHSVSDAQLEAYEASMMSRHGLHPPACTFTLIVRSPTRDALAVARRHPAWRVASWERFLVDLEGALAPLDVDDDDFRRFRRTIWRRIAR